MSDDTLTSALNIMRRMPPANIENCLAGLLELIPDATDDLLNHIDQPLKLMKDTKAGQEFILCDYNRDGDSYRSPWSNQYFPALEDGLTPNSKLRAMEVEANKLFDVYRKMYFEGGHSSVYFFETDENSDQSFGACFLVLKDVDNNVAKSLEKGWWNSIHVFQVTPADGKKSYNYSLTTTVMVSMGLADGQKFGNVDLSGSMNKQIEKRMTVDETKSHIANMGTIIEDMELDIRNAIEGIYIQKTREVVNGMRSVGAAREKAWEAVAAGLSEAIKSKASN